MLMIEEEEATTKLASTAVNVLIAERFIYKSQEECFISLQYSKATGTRLIAILSAPNERYNCFDSRMTVCTLL